MDRRGHRGRAHRPICAASISAAVYQIDGTACPEAHYGPWPMIRRGIGMPKGTTRP